MVTDDIVVVKLTARGAELAPIVVAGGDHERVFIVGETHRLTRAEFAARYERSSDLEGKPLLEISGEESRQDAGATKNAAAKDGEEN